jgi:putative SOS response-associated peptidase YedK
MCTQYTPTRADRLTTTWGVAPHRIDYVKDAGPGYLAPILRLEPVPPQASVLRADLAVFGLIPGWSRDGKNFRHCYNARSETVAEKPSFRQAWRNRQWCVIPADAFFEPNYESGKAVRWRIERADGAPMAIAGIWEHWRAGNGETVASFSMLTINADAHPVMRRFHAPGDEKRSVVLLDPDRVSDWLGASPEQARELMAAFEPDSVKVQSDPSARRSRKTSASESPDEGLFKL